MQNTYLMFIGRPTNAKPGWRVSKGYLLPKGILANITILIIVAILLFGEYDG